MGKSAPRTPRQMLLLRRRTPSSLMLIFQVASPPRRLSIRILLPRVTSGSRQSLVSVLQRRPPTSQAHQRSLASHTAPLRAIVASRLLFQVLVDRATQATVTTKAMTPAV